MKKMDKILTYENRKMSMARIRSSITWIIMPRQNINIFTFQLIFKSKFYIREERFRDGFLREKCILLGIARMGAGGRGEGPDHIFWHCRLVLMISKMVITDLPPG